MTTTPEIVYVATFGAALARPAEDEPSAADGQMGHALYGDPGGRHVIGEGPTTGDAVRVATGLVGAAAPTGAAVVATSPVVNVKLSRTDAPNRANLDDAIAVLIPSGNADPVPRSGRGSWRSFRSWASRSIPPHLLVPGRLERPRRYYVYRLTVSIF